RARRPHDGHIFPTLDFQRHLPQCVDRLRPHLVTARDLVEPDQGHSKGVEIRRPKSETRRKAEIRNPKGRRRLLRAGSGFQTLNPGFEASDVIPQFCFSGAFSLSPVAGPLRIFLPSSSSRVMALKLPETTSWPSVRPSVISQ